MGNLKLFGDGIHDDTKAIQSMLLSRLWAMEFTRRLFLKNEKNPVIFLII